jgi:hypothetical protein
MNVPIDPRPEQQPSWQPSRPPANTRGSLWLGFGLAWVVMIVGNILAAFLLGGFEHEAMLSVFALPWLGAIGLIIWLATTGRPRTAIGVAIGLATIVAIVVLLIAACFSLLSNNFR